jgi:hypothetical protein
MQQAVLVPVPVPKTVPEEPHLDQMTDLIRCLLHLALPPGAEWRATEFGGLRIPLQTQCTASHTNTALLNCHRMFYSYKNLSFKMNENSNALCRRQYLTNQIVSRG